MPGRSAIGIVRVSQVRGREGASFASPEDQRSRVEALCDREGLRLINVIEEMDVSGRTPLQRREGLRSAIEAVEAGDAEVIAVAYFDRLVRSLKVQEELVSRVEAAGGSVLAVDVGRVTNGSAAQWLPSTLLGAVNEYKTREVAERVSEAQANAVARGVAPWRHTTPGYTRNSNRVFEPNEQAPAVAEAFRMRGSGASIRECRDHLARHGVDRKFSSVTRLFHDRAVLGELHFGDLVNLEAHQPIVTPEEFKRAQRSSAPRGRQPQSQLLLARLGVLRCATCDSRMVAGTSNHGTTPTYRCRNPDCKRKVVISARVAEPILVVAVQEALHDVEGRASAERGARDAARKLEQDQAKLDKAIETLEDFMDEPGAVNKVRKLRDERDAAQLRVDQLGGEQAAVVVSAAGDWDRLTLDERRDLIRAVIRRAAVAPGSGRDRIAVELVSE